MRYTGNTAKQMLMAAMAASWINSQHRQWLDSQYRKIESREIARMSRRGKEPAEIVQQRISLAAARRELRAEKRYRNHVRCLANNPCLVEH